jgi:hypothetical protein
LIRSIIKAQITTITVIINTNPINVNKIEKGSQIKQKHHHQEIDNTPAILSTHNNPVSNIITDEY